MDSDEELDLMLLPMVWIKNKSKSEKKESMGKGHLQELQNLCYWSTCQRNAANKYRRLLQVRFDFAFVL